MQYLATASLEASERLEITPETNAAPETVATNDMAVGFAAFARRGAGERRAASEQGKAERPTQLNELLNSPNWLLSEQEPTRR